MSCPEFEYEHVDGYREILEPRVAAILTALRRGGIETGEATSDTRRAHAIMFRGLTPEKYPHYAGNYRGAALPCLDEYAVHMPGDPRVGFPPDRVEEAMAGFARQVGRALGVLDQSRDSREPSELKLYAAVVIACRLLVEFNGIHPYANGNGHIGRLIVWFVLGRYGYWPEDWSVEPRPPDPEYSECVKISRDGDCGPLEQFVLSCIRGR